MAVEPNLRGVHVSAGSGIVANLENFTAFASGDEEALNTLVVRLNALASAPWQEIVRAITTEIVAAGFDGYPSLACVKVEADRVAAFVFGETTLSIATEQRDCTLDGRDSSTWIDVTVHGEVDRIIAGSQGDSPVVGVLRDGVVPAGGFMFDSVGPMPASGRWDAVAQSERPNAHVDAQPAQSVAPVEPAAPEAIDEPIDEQPEQVIPSEEVTAEIATVEITADEMAADEVAPTAVAMTSEEPAIEAETLAEPEPAHPSAAAMPPIPEEPPTAPEPTSATEETNEDIPEFTPEMHMLAPDVMPLAPEDPIESVTALSNEAIVPLPPEDPIESVTVLPNLEDEADAPAPDIEDEDAAAGGLFARIDERIRTEDEIAEETADSSIDDPWSDAGNLDDDGWSTVSTDDDSWSKPTPAAGIVGLAAPIEPTEAPEALPPLPTEPTPASMSSTETLAYSNNQVRGVLCPNQHLTNPAHTSCYECGTLVDLDAETTTGDRPVLGKVTFDDGAVLSLDRPAAIGSNVPSGYEIDGELATIVRLDDGIEGVSPVHVEVRLRGWDVEIVDMESSSGTYTIDADDRHSRTRLRSGQVTQLRPGMSVETGGRSFTFSVGS